MSLISGSSDSAKECRSVAISVDGLMFSRQRECVLSGNKNTDINPVKLGAYSFEEGKAEYKYVIWNRGTSTAPKGRYDRISVLTWQHGGFADMYPNIETFAAQLRLNEKKELLKEFNSAYAAMVKVIEEGKLRFVKGEKNKVAMRLQEARKVSLVEFHKIQRKVRIPHQAIEVHIYDKLHPGRRQQKGYQVAACSVNGQMKQCVLVPKNAEGHYDLDIEDIQGSKQNGVVDDGENVIAGGQLRSKFQTLNATNRSFEEMGVANGKVEEDVLIADAEDAKPNSENGASSASEDEEDELDFVRKTLLCDGDSKPKAQTKQHGTLSLPSTICQKHRKSGSNADDKASVVSSRASTGKSMLTNSSEKDSKRADKSGGDKRVEKGRPSKFGKMTTEEVLTNCQFPEKSEEVFNCGLAMLESAPCLAYTISPEEFTKIAKAAYIKVRSAHMHAVQVSIKLGRLSGIHDDITDKITTFRAQSSAVMEFLTVFKEEKKRMPDKMLAAMEEMRHLDLVVPPIADSMFFQMKCADHARFHKLDVVKELCLRTTGYFSFLLHGANSLEDTAVVNLIVDTAVDAIQTVLNDLDPESSQDSIELLHRLVEFVSALVDCDELKGELETPFGLLRDALSGQGQSLAKLEEMKTDVSYGGILKPLLLSAGWSTALRLCDQAKATELSESGDKVLRAVDTLNSPSFGMSDREAFELTMSDALDMISEDSPPKLLASLRRALETVAERAKLAIGQLDRSFDCFSNADDTEKIQEANVEVEALGRRSIFDFWAMVEAIPESHALLLKENIRIHQALKELQAHQILWNKRKDLFDAAVSAVQLRPDDPTGKRNPDVIMRAWDDVSSELQNDGLPENVAMPLKSLQTQMGVDDAGRQVCENKMEEFKTLAKSLLQMLLQPEKDTKDIVRVAAKILKSLHVLRQCCVYSETPTLHKAVVSFVADVVIPMADHDEFFRKLDQEEPQTVENIPSLTIAQARLADKDALNDILV